MFVFDVLVMNNFSKELIVNVQCVILMRKINILQQELYNCGSVYMTINGVESVFCRCSIYYYSCDVLWLNLSHLAAHESFFPV